jgi:hypothetical protein
MKNSKGFWFCALKARHHAKALGSLLFIAAVIAGNNGLAPEIAAVAAIAVGILFMAFYTVVHCIPLRPRVRSLLSAEHDALEHDFMVADMVGGRLQADPSIMLSISRNKEDELTSLKSEMTGLEWFQYCEAKRLGTKIR